MLDAFAKTTLFLALQVLATESCAHVQRSLFPAGGYSAGDADGNFLDEPGFAEKYWPHWLSPGKRCSGRNRHERMWIRVNCC